MCLVGSRREPDVIEIESDTLHARLTCTPKMLRNRIQIVKPDHSPASLPLSRCGFSCASESPRHASCSRMSNSLAWPEAFPTTSSGSLFRRVLAPSAPQTPGSRRGRSTIHERSRSCPGHERPDHSGLRQAGTSASGSSAGAPTAITRLRTVFQTISLPRHTLRSRPSLSAPLLLHSAAAPGVPEGEENLVHRAAVAYGRAAALLYRARRSA